MLRRLKVCIGLLVCSLAVLSTAALTAQEQAPPAKVVKVAIFEDKGVAAAGPKNLLRSLTAEYHFSAKTLNAEAIRNGSLKDFDVLICPGGTGSGQGNTLAEDGREAIRKFVDNGGGFMGICAGAYLVSADYSWSLNLLDAKVLDRAHWARGYGDVVLKLKPETCVLFSTDSKEVTVHYHQGPLLAPAGKDNIPDYEELASFQTEIAKNGAPQGVMIGTTAMARGTFGRGRVFALSPHPEKNGDYDHFIRAAVNWTANNEPTKKADSDQKSAPVQNAKPSTATTK
jgi:putative intracellular protease/amidase